MKTELSVEETNKLRAQLGLKPIPTKDSKPFFSPKIMPHQKSEAIAISKSTAVAQSLKNLSESTILEGEIMTLKDSKILDDQDDELITNTALVEQQLKPKHAARLHKLEEDGSSDNEEEYFQIGSAKVKLRVNEEAKQGTHLKQMEQQNPHKKLVEFQSDSEETELLATVAEQDFAKSKNGKFKKRKKKKTRKVDMLEDDEEEVSLNNHVDLDKEDLEADELEMVLAAQRRGREKTKGKRGRKRGFEEKEEQDEEKMDSEESNGLIVDGTGEFLSEIKRMVRKGGEENVEKKEDAAKQEIEPQEESTSPSIPIDDNDTPNFNGKGLAATLQFLQKSSIIKVSEEAVNSDRERNKQRKLASEIQTAGDDSIEKFKNYNPSVTITYTDDDNNVLNQKEAYKHLSHKFHGKAPSKQKQAKLAKKRS